MMASINKRPNGTWRARYRDDTRSEHARHFGRKIDAQAWLDEQTADLVAGTHVNTTPGAHDSGGVVRNLARGLLRQPSLNGPASRGTHRPDPHRVRQPAALRRSAVPRPDVVREPDGRGTGRLLRLRPPCPALAALRDAVHDGLVAKSPCSRRTSPKPGKQRAYVATTEQVWALHDAMPEHLRAAVLLGAFAGL